MIIILLNGTVRILFCQYRHSYKTRTSSHNFIQHEHFKYKNIQEIMLQPIDKSHHNFSQNHHNPVRIQPQTYLEW